MNIEDEIQNAINADVQADSIRISKEMLDWLQSIGVPERKPLASAILPFDNGSFDLASAQDAADRAHFAYRLTKSSDLP